MKSTPTPRAKRRKWDDPAEIALLKLLYPNRDTSEIAEAMGRTTGSIRGKADALGLRKSREWLASTASGRLQKGCAYGVSTRFQKGQQAWNKGLKGINPGGEAGQFKRGNRSGLALSSYKPIGFERLGKDGYLERKINDDMPLYKRWRAVHLLIWEAANGPIPSGCAVSFRDGNKLNLALDNLQLVTRAELMKRNSYHQYGPEISKIIQLRGALALQINKRERNAA